MNKLVNLVKIAENNKECVILEVNCKPLDLIKLGCFNGNEIMFRLTKGDDHTCTVWTSDGKNYSWFWGRSGHTLVSDQMSRMGKLIQTCIEEDFEIYIGKDIEMINKTLHIKSLDDVRESMHEIKLMYWKNGGEICCHRDGVFYKHFPDQTTALNHFAEKGYEIHVGKSYQAKTGCFVKVYKIEKVK